MKSKSNSWPQLLEKKDLFLSDSRCLAVWIVDPETRTIRLLAKGTHHIFEGQSSISIPFALGTGCIVIEDIFNGIIES